MPAALVALPDASGLYVLTGSRPAVLVERLDDPDDGDPLVAAAASCWVLTMRTPTDSSSRPTAPTSIFVEWDPAEREAVQAGLARLGVRLTGCTASRLTDLQPSLGLLLESGLKLTISPGKERWLLERGQSGTWKWTRRTSDTSTGLYRYRLAQGNVFAWRPDPGAALVQVEPAVGRWLAHRAAGDRSVLLHEFLAHRLVVPEGTPLPSLLDRSLTLRTGLPPYTVLGHTVARAHPGWAYRVYENVDAATAEQVAGLLRQGLITDYGS
jgi:hypothetical protein